MSPKNLYTCLSPLAVQFFNYSQNVAGFLSISVRLNLLEKNCLPISDEYRNFLQLFVLLPYNMRTYLIFLDVDLESWSVFGISLMAALRQTLSDKICIVASPSLSNKIKAPVEFIIRCVQFYMTVTYVTQANWKLLQNPQ